LKRESEADGNENGILFKSLKMREKLDLAMRRKGNFFYREREEWRVGQEKRESKKKKGSIEGKTKGK